MAKLKWDAVGERLYETGTKNGVLFPQTVTGAYGVGVAWNGLVAVRQSPDGAEESPIYADDMKYLSMTSAENFKGTIEAYTYPEEFAACDGSAQIVSGVTVGQQSRKAFGFAYVTTVGNDVEGNDFGQKIHIIYGAKVAPTERSYETINDDPSALTFSWEFSTTPEQVEAAGIRPTSYVCVDSTKTTPEVFQRVADALFGTAELEAELPTVDELLALVKLPVLP